MLVLDMNTMKFMCSVCREEFTGGHDEIIFTTQCGHVYHHHCILQSIERSKTCPNCRTAVTKNTIFKLNFCFDDGLTEREVEMNRCMDMNLKFELSLKNKELEDLKRSSKHALEINAVLRSEIRKHEENARAHSTITFRLEQEIQALKASLKARTEELLRRNENLRATGSMFNRPVEGTNVDADIINLADISDPEILEDIEYSRSEPRGFNNSIEVIDLEDPEPSRSHDSPMEKIQELESQLELKNAMLSSALAQIDALEKKLENNQFSSNFAQFETL